MSECLGEVKRVMGPDAVILHSRTLAIKRFLGLRRREIVEITAGRGLNGGPRGPRQNRIQHAPAPQTRGGNAVAVASASASGSGAFVPSHVPAPAAQTPPAPAPAIDPIVLNRLINEMGQMKQMMGAIERRERLNSAPDIAEELLDYYTLMVDRQVERELAEQICRTLGKSMRPDHLQQKQFVCEKIAEQIEKMLPTSGPITRVKSTGPHVVALIGPTGVGKTTTIAKLAAKLKLDENRKVGLITIDTYRIAAVDQLKKYADIIGSPLKVVASPEDLRQAVASMRDCDFVLIDTAGRSPRDSLKLNELKAFLTAAEPDEVHLVLSTVVSRGSLDLAIEKFSNVRADKVIFTKLDEASHVGAMLGVVRSIGKPLSYITIGQDVPADIEVARGKRLAQLILGSES
jgi:flagellar biosynthesis protein FlhF